MLKVKVLSEKDEDVKKYIKKGIKLFIEIYLAASKLCKDQ